MLVTPSGRRVELRRVGSTNTYESADGSYIQMTDGSPNGAVVRTSNGTVLTFAPSVNNEMRCTQIKDRNGNFITITYNATGRVATVTDTLKRVVKFNYDAASYLTSISQTRGAATHYWARFYYGSLTVQHNFTGLTVVGPQSQTAIGVLNQGWLPDGSRYYFDYTSWGQVWKIRRNSGTDDDLSYVSYNLPLTSAVAETDCPRFTQRRDWARDWNGDTDATPATAEEAVTTYTVDAGGAWGQQKMPDNTIYKKYYATTGWQKGLVTATEVLVGTVRRRWTTTAWEQDNPFASYPINPRPTETVAEDEAGNKRKTKVEYYPASAFGLPKDVSEYGFKVENNVETEQLLRKAHTDYNLSASYNSATRRIIGLVSMKTVYDGAGNVVSKVEYQYDEGALPNHDTAYDGATAYAGRGNPTSVGGGTPSLPRTPRKSWRRT